MITATCRAALLLRSCAPKGTAEGEIRRQVERIDITAKRLDSEAGIGITTGLLTDYLQCHYCVSVCLGMQKK
jgi:hypothetical protein